MEEQWPMLPRPGKTDYEVRSTSSSQYLLYSYERNTHGSLQMYCRVSWELLVLYVNTILAVAKLAVMPVMLTMTKNIPELKIFFTCLKMEVWFEIFLKNRMLL